MGSGSAVKTSVTGAAPKRHSPVFLAVFAVFLLATAICIAGTVLGVAAAQPSHHDTQWFWASGHLLAHGRNPYDRAAMREMETSLGFQGTGKVLPITLNPPYTFFLFIPLGVLSAREAIVAWSLLLAVFLWIAVLAMRPMVEQRRERAYMWLAWCFAPALCCIEMGQTGLVVLLGLALFLRLNESGPFWAGAALSLCAVKPHLLLPFGVVLIMWVLTRRRWSVFAGAIAALAVESLVAMAFDHAIWAHYRAMMRTEPFVDDFLPTLGVALRYALDRTAMWIEFVPAAAGCVWGLWYFWRNREHWDWRTHGSLLTMVSLVAAPYSWFTDQVIALPAILFALMGEKPLRRGSVTLLLAVMSAGAVEMMVTKTLYFKPYLWEGLAWLGWYLYAVSGGPEVSGEVVESAIMP